MFLKRMLFAGLLVVLIMTACAQKPNEHRGKIYCPECGAEVDVLFQKRFK